jgi:hypothetical protein
MTFPAMGRSNLQVQIKEGSVMAEDLQQQLQALRDHLDSDPPITEQEREDLNNLVADVELKLQAENAGLSDPSLVDGVKLAVERFEVAHPTTAGTLRNIMNSLASMGI